MRRGLAIDRFVVISGCSGGGKSALLEELRRQGYPTVEEPGRRIVKEQLLSGGTALPWTGSRSLDVASRSHFRPQSGWPTPRQMGVL